MSRIEEALAKAGQEHATRKAPPLRRGAPPNGPLPAQGEIGTVHAPEPNLVVVNTPFSPEAEEYRKLKEALVKRTRGEEFRNLLMVSSPGSGDGKSITAINLAASLAQEYDHTVLLVDADLRGPSCHRYLGHEPRAGLSDCLVDGLDPGEALINTGIGRLSFLPAGKSIPNPGEVFASNMMKNLVREMKERYPERYVIIDTPPVLPFAETRSLSHHVDGILLVVREEKTSVDEMEAAVTALGSNVLGLVYNASDRADRSSYGYGYNRYYS
jgi:exopolysaccharide/PEP-CTERM locus tyrosine autokinase